MILVDERTLLRHGRAEFAAVAPGEVRVVVDQEEAEYPRTLLIES